MAIYPKLRLLRRSATGRDIRVFLSMFQEVSVRF